VAIVAAIVMLALGYPLGFSILSAWGAQIGSFTLLLWITSTRSKDDPAQELAQDVDEGFSLADDRIWRSYLKKDSGEVELRIALLAPSSRQSLNVANDLSGLGHEVHHSNDCSAMLSAVQTQPDCWSLLIVDLDLLEDLDTIVSELLEFREWCPDLPILLLSGNVRRDEFSSHRKAIGDVTLRKPVFRQSLLNGIRATGLRIE
jgi:CheY-like chemotaxis protein